MDVVSKVENTKIGSRDAPAVDIIIADSGELEMETVVDEAGNEVPVREEL